MLLALLFSRVSRSIFLSGSALKHDIYWAHDTKDSFSNCCAAKEITNCCDFHPQNNSNNNLVNEVQVHPDFEQTNLNKCLKFEKASFRSRLIFWRFWQHGLNMSVWWHHYCCKLVGPQLLWRSISVPQDILTFKTIKTTPWPIFRYPSAKTVTRTNKPAKPQTVSCNLPIQVQIIGVVNSLN